MSTNPQDGSRPTVVLVHGAFAESASWNGVIRRLQDQGYTAIAAANPLRGVAGDAEFARQHLRGRRGAHRPGRPLLRRHLSSAMRPATRSNVKALVYVGRLRSRGGRERLQSSRGASPGQHAWRDAVSPSRSPTAAPTSTSARRMYHQQFAHDVARRAEPPSMAATQRPVRDVALNEASGPPGVEVDPFVVRVRGARQEHPRGGAPLHGRAHRSPRGRRDRRRIPRG